MKNPLSTYGDGRWRVVGEGKVVFKRVLVFTAAALVLAATATASPRSETIVLSGWPESDPATATLESVIASFEAAHPGIHVDYRPLVNYTGDIEAAFAAGAAPDVFYVDSSLAPDWIARGYLQPLHGFAVKSGFDTGYFFPVLRKAFEGPGGQPYGFPKDWSPLALWTNDALVETAPTTWTQLRATAQQLRASTGVTPVCISVDWARLLAFVEENGASLAMIDSPQAVAAVQFYVGLVHDGLAATPDMLAEPWCGQALADGRVAMAFEGNWLLPVMLQTSLVYSIHPMPANLRRGNLAFTVAYAMASSSQHKQAAWELLSYLTGRIGAQELVNGAGAQPSRDDVTPAPGTEVFQGEAPIATVWQFGLGFNDAVTLANTELGNVFAAPESIDEMLADFKAALGGQPLHARFAPMAKRLHIPHFASETAAPDSSGAIVAAGFSDAQGSLDLAAFSAWSSPAELALDICVEAETTANCDDEAQCSSRRGRHTLRHSLAVTPSRRR